ncbi:ribosomal RNA small subunit methyltransferase A [Candidatus Peregrinibacteria bacterium]|nr:ribosomal RNA small subunit methyltransferase A [Candidatus Peregrinibacteria bacterium]
MSKLVELQGILRLHGLWAKKSFGQNFLVDEEALERIVQTANIHSSDTVVEVGPGTGFLTERLIQKAKRVITVEFDADMVEVMKRRFKGVPNLEIIHSDILNWRIDRYGLKNKGYKVVANIPYYITSPLIKHFLQSACRPNKMVILVQKEVAEKVIGKTGKSVITIETQVFGRPEIVAIVKAASFYPTPKVDSAVLRIEVYEKPLVPERELKDFFRVVHGGYSQKRKKLRNTLAAAWRVEPAEAEVIIKKAGLDPDLRPEDLEIGDWIKLVDKN